MNEAETVETLFEKGILSKTAHKKAMAWLNKETNSISKEKPKSSSSISCIDEPDRPNYFLRGGF